MNDKKLEKKDDKLQFESIEQTELEWANEIVVKIRKNILAALFEYDLDPVGLEGDARSMEIIRFYRALFKQAINDDLFNLIDEILERKIKGEFDENK